MIRSLPPLMRGLFVLFISTTLFWPSGIQAQQNNLKTQATEPQSVQQVTGHNNLRKLAKIYDKQLREAQGSVTPVGDDAQLRRLYELELLKDPATGQIPEDIRKKELAFAERMSQGLNQRAGGKNARVIEDWRARGPYNVGGRTRALAIDLDDENTILAGGVSGGMWRSEDGGLTWTKTTGTSEIQSVTAIVQDPRPGFHNVWYYSTGERIGNSAGGGGAFFGGNGIYKSTDGAHTWSILPVTADNRPQGNTPFDLTFNLAIHPATGDLYAATWNGVHRTTDGGISFTQVIAGGNDVWTDVMVTPGGALYVTFDSDGVPNKGVFRSTDGTTWTNITPAGYPAVYGRAVLGYTPTDENIVYVFADGGGPGFLWRYTHGAGTAWTNLTANMPAFGGSVGNLNTQGGYNMVIKVHPTNPNIVFMGATNLYRSPTGFTSRTGMAWIGGYSPLNDVSIYPNQHPDHHALIFYPSNPSRALSGNDGGVQYTDDILASNPNPQPVLWTSRNNGYLTTQPYAISLITDGTGDQLMAGFQDNGTWSTSSPDLLTHWSEEFGGDGSYNAYADNGLTRYVSAQTGNIYRLNYLSADAPGGDYVSFARITPAGATGFAFITPFVLDPNNDNTMYLPAGGRIWRNDNLDAVPIFSNAPTSVNWTNLANSQVATGNVTALAVSRMPANRLYYGTNTGLVYRIDNANIGDQPKTDISTGKGLPPGFVNCITVDPANADRVFVVFSSYNIRSVFYSGNGGTTWTDISSNLEETPAGTGSGPSTRWLAIEGNSDRYYLGTSTGLYSTVTLNGESTVWTREDEDGMGNVVVPQVRTREDGFVAVATHGNGVFSGKFEVTPLPQPTLKVVNPIDDYEVFANSPSTIIDIASIFQDMDGDPIAYSLINTNPSLLTATLNGTLLTVSYAANATGKGSIGVVATAGDESISEPFTVTVRNLEYILYNQNTASPGTRPSQLFTNLGNALVQSADDFEVPAGQTWSIEKVFAPGAVNGIPVLNSVFVVIYQDNAGNPGAEVYNSGSLVPASGTANTSFDLVLPTPASLGEGKYWISVYARLAFVNSTQWFWRTTGTVTGSPGKFRDPANLFGTGAVDWTNQSVAFGGAPTDMLFTLFGKGTGIPAPASPSNLDALYSSDVKIDLTWSDNSSTEIGFVIERSTDGTNFAKRTTVGPNNSSYSDTDLFDPALTYFYRVAAIGISDTSAYSNIDSTAVIPDAPVAKMATFVLPSFFFANWESSVGASHYELDVSSDNFATFLPGYDGRVVTGNTYLVWGTQYNKSYTYRLRAVNAGGESANSNVIIVAPVKNLKLDAVCSDNPQTTRRWKITNPNPFNIEVEWAVHKTSQRGTVSAPPGQSYFVTNTVHGSNTTIITWRDDFFIPHIDVKGSSKKQCNGVGSDIADARYGSDDPSIETDSPFIIDAYPNPSTDRFNIMIASPFEDEVEMEVLGQKGEVLFTTKTQSNIVVEVDATKYPAGLYIVKAKQLMYNKTLKLIKK
jgi:hypothetical protein